MQTSRLSLPALLLSLILLSSCGPKLPSQLKSPYQEALEAYYAGLDNRTYEDALTKIDGVLRDNPADLEARTLRTQLRLQQYRAEADPAKRLQLFFDLRSLYRALDTDSDRSGWVMPRLYVSVGDVLLLDGYRLLQSAEADQGNMDFNFWKAYTHFRGALDYYAFAESLAENADSVSRGVIRERNNAEDGIIHALAGLLESTSILDPAQQFPVIQQHRGRAQNLLQQRINGIKPPLDPPSRSLIRLEASDQNIAGGLLRLSSADKRKLYQEACAANDPEGPDPAGIWVEACHDLERSAYHYLMEGMLTGRQIPEYDQSIQLMDQLLKRDPACP